MPNRAHSKATRLAATFLARLTSADVAASTFRLDVKTVRAWQAGAVELPDDQWQAIETVLLTRGAEMAARGQTTGLVATLTAAGISSRNTRYQQLIERREARRAGEQVTPETAPSSPFQAAIDNLSDQQQRLVRDLIELTLLQHEGEEEQPPPQTEAEQEAGFLAWLARIAALTPEEVAAERTAVSAELDKVEAQQRARYPAAREAARQPDPPAAAPPQDAPQVIELAERRPIGPLTVLPVGQHLEGERGWHPSWRAERR